MVATGPRTDCRRTDRSRPPAKARARRSAGCNRWLFLSIWLVAPHSPLALTIRSPRLPHPGYAAGQRFKGE